MYFNNELKKLLDDWQNQKPSGYRSYYYNHVGATGYCTIEVKLYHEYPGYPNLKTLFHSQYNLFGTGMSSIAPDDRLVESLKPIVYNDIYPYPNL